MNAKEARELAETNRDSKAELFVRRILARIESAAKDGGVMIHFDITGLSANVVSSIRAKLTSVPYEYKVDIDEDRNDVSFIISW
jgi:hypothetical protein